MFCFKLAIKKNSVHVPSLLRQLDTCTIIDDETVPFETKQILPHITLKKIF